MKILLTGASGFIGSALMTELLTRGHEVTAFSRNPLQSQSNEREGVSWIHGELDDEFTLEKVAESQPDVCVHAAWIATPGEYLESEENDDLVDSSYRFLSSLSQVGIRRIVVLGTCLEKVEGHVSRYATAKNRLRTLLEEDLPKDVSFCWTRLFFPYGEGEPEVKLLSYIVDCLSKGNCPDLKSPHSECDYIHVKDVAGALATISEAGSSGVFEIGSGKAVSVLEIASNLAIIFDRIDLKAQLHERAANHLRKSRSKIVADLAALKSLEWGPKVSLETGLRMLASSKNQR